MDQPRRRLRPGLPGCRRQRRRPRSGRQRPLFLLGHHRAAEKLPPAGRSCRITGRCSESTKLRCPPPARPAPHLPVPTTPVTTPAYWPSLQFTIAPTLFNVSVSGGAISFSISNLTVGATNTIERSFNLATNGWTAVSSFVAASTSTNWSETLQPGWTKAFYRLHSQE